MVHVDLVCAVFPRVARENRTPLKIKYRSAEGQKRQLRKSYIFMSIFCPARYKGAVKDSWQTFAPLEFEEY